MTANSVNFHAMVGHLEWVSTLSTPFLLPQLNGLQSTKQGWADTFERLALRLGLATTSPTGARLFTGHSARATGATHLAHTQIKLKLWRIQLFGRWGSDCFKRCIRDAPLRQLHGLAQEASLRTFPRCCQGRTHGPSQLWRGIPSSPSGALRTQSVACLADCEAAELITEPLPVQTECGFVINRSRHGKVHKVVPKDHTLPHYLWHTRCFWYFARHQADYELSDSLAPHMIRCAKCVNLPRRRLDKESSDSSSISSSSSL